MRLALIGNAFLTSNPTIFVLHVIGTIAALMMIASLLRLVIVLQRSGEIPSGLVLIAATLFTGTVARVCRLVLAWQALPPLFWLDFYPTFMGLIAVVCMPIILYRYYGPLDSRSLHPVLSRIRAFAAIANAIGVPAVVLWSYLHQWNAGLLLSISIGCAVTAALLLVNASNFKRLRIRHRGLILFFILTTLGLMTISVTLGYTYVHHLKPKDSLSFCISVSLSHMTIILGTLFVFANLRLADLLLKRSLRIYLLTIGTVATWYSIYALASTSARYHSARAEIATQFLSAAVIATLVLMAKPVTTAIDRWLDSWVFEQPDFASVNQSFWERLLATSQESEIYRVTERTAQSILSLPSVKIFSRAEAGIGHPDAFLVGSGPCFLKVDDPIRYLLSPPIDLLVPIFRSGVTQQVIAVGRGQLRPPLTNAELAFLERVAVQVSTRLGILAAEELRMGERERESALRQEVAEAELRALRAQINPHFLFNSLNTIADLTVIAPQKAEKMTMRLATVFRYVLAHTDTPYASVREEIDFIRSYLEIEQTRFEHRLRVEYDIDDRILEERIPALLLQPLVENALKHGLGSRRQGGSIHLSARYGSSGLMELSVSDDGEGLPTFHPPSNDDRCHVGLDNVKKRLLTAYQDKAVLHLLPRSGGGTIALITILKGNGITE